MATGRRAPGKDRRTLAPAQISIQFDDCISTAAARQTGPNQVSVDLVKVAYTADIGPLLSNVATEPTTIAGNGVAALDQGGGPFPAITATVDASGLVDFDFGVPVAPGDQLWIGNGINQLVPGTNQKVALNYFPSIL